MEEHGFHIPSGRPLGEALPRTTVSPREAWQILRTIAAQMRDVHEGGQTHGSIRVESIRVISPNRLLLIPPSGGWLPGSPQRVQQDLRQLGKVLLQLLTDRVVDENQLVTRRDIADLPASWVRMIAPAVPFADIHEFLAELDCIDSSAEETSFAASPVTPRPRSLIDGTEVGNDRDFGRRDIRYLWWLAIPATAALLLLTLCVGSAVVSWVFQSAAHSPTPVVHLEVDDDPVVVLEREKPAPKVLGPRLELPPDGEDIRAQPLPEKDDPAIAIKDLAPTVQNSIGMKLNLIPAGTFLMGSHESRAKLRQDIDLQFRSVDDEFPAHRVTLRRRGDLGWYAMALAPRSVRPWTASMEV